MFDTFWKVSWQDPSQTVPKSCSGQTLIFYSSYPKDFISQLYLSTRPFHAVGPDLGKPASHYFTLAPCHSMSPHVTPCHSTLPHSPSHFFPHCIDSFPHLRLNYNVDLVDIDHCLYQMGVCGQCCKLVKAMWLSVCKLYKYWSTVAVYQRLKTRYI